MMWAHSEIVDGLPIEYGYNGTASNDLFTDLSDNEQQKALDWVATYIKPIKSENRKHTSYGLKHLLEHDTGIYMCNNQFKHLMLICGYKPVRENALNWTFRISEKQLRKRSRR